MCSLTFEERDHFRFSAIRGFITAFMLPRTLIVIGSVVGGLALIVQTVIIYQQTTLLRHQAYAQLSDQGRYWADLARRSSIQEEKLRRALRTATDLMTPGSKREELFPPRSDKFDALGPLSDELELIALDCDTNTTALEGALSEVVVLTHQTPEPSSMDQALKELSENLKQNIKACTDRKTTARERSDALFLRLKDIAPDESDE